MQRMMSHVLAAAAVGGLALVPAASRAQSSYYQNQPTATGNAYLNENDYDYNRQHMTPPDRSPPQAPNNANGYNQNNGYYGGYPPPQPPRPNDYGQYRNAEPGSYGRGTYDRGSYDRGYQDGLAQRRYTAPQQNYRGYQPYEGDQD